MLQTIQTTMSSREISELVESRHDNVKRSMETLRDSGLISFTQSQETSHDGPGARPVTVYLVNKRDSYVIVAQLSPAFTARLVDRWQELEARAMLTHSAGGLLRDELEAVDVLARILNVANSGKLGMVRASLAHHGAAHLLPTLPVYAIDAPSSTVADAPLSSMPTASLTELLREHEIDMAAVTAYHPTTGMTFGLAIEALKAGQRVARARWNGKGMWLSLSCDGTREVPAENFLSPHNAEHARQSGGKATVLPSITMKTAAGEILMGWRAIQTDMLAEDWQIVS